MDGWLLNWLVADTLFDVVSRIRELEEENRQLKIQNEKQQALMNKYRERWEKLKESAKKRRAQPEQVCKRFRLEQ